jgi:deoxyribodipyrimidine photo-lyase
MSNSVMWFRRDLRLEDNPALIAASKAGNNGANCEVTPLFVLDPMFLERSGAPRLAFLFRSLRELNREMNGTLVVRVGNPVDVVAKVAQEVGATEVFAAKDFAPYGQKRDAAVAAALRKVGVNLNQVGSAYAVEPGTVRKADMTPYAVFTPFSKIWLAHGWPAPTDKAKVKFRGAPEIASEKIPDDPPLTATIAVAGKKAAWDRWQYFVENALDKYKSERNNPDRDGCSQMSVYLRFGIVHPRQLLAELEPNANHDHYRSELCWREFYADVLFHQPHTTWKNLQPKMDSLQVDTDAKAKKRFEVWCEGKTGYPIIDAGMRQMLATGWMHNRVRMIVASFLVKDLHLPWQWGAKFFMSHLVDGDIASNNHGWQWTAGTGTDAAPYFRVFNPVLQGEKFDPEGNFVRQWLPELRDMPKKFVHAPWMAEGGLFSSYPAPMVDHSQERDEALSRYKISGEINRSGV